MLNPDSIIALAKQKPLMSSIVEMAADFDSYQDHDTFIQRVNHHIDIASKLVSEVRHLAHTESEDAITARLYQYLTGEGMKVGIGNCSSGEVDLCIKHGPYKWVGEAKIFNSLTAAIEGMLQLSTRYTTGHGDESHCGVLLYVKTNTLRKKITALKTRYTILSDLFSDILVNNCKTCNQALITQHSHVSSGDPFTVRHKFVNLYFHPEDKSGRINKTDYGNIDFDGREINTKLMNIESDVIIDSSITDDDGFLAKYALDDTPLAIE